MIFFIISLTEFFRHAKASSRTKSVYNTLFTDNKSFFVVSMSDYGAQIYELMAQTVSEQKT